MDIFTTTVAATRSPESPIPKVNKKPRNPYPDFPLTAHRNGQSCKRIRGKLHYFGTDADAALAKYLNECDDLQAGRQTRTTTRGTLSEMFNSYLAAVDERRQANRIADVTCANYVVTGKDIVEQFGRTADPTQIRPTEFAGFRNALAAKLSPTRVGKMVTHTQMMFKWAYESEVIDSLPNFGPDFKSTNKRQARIAKARKGERLFPAEGIRELLSRADDVMNAMILLGVNAGLGNTDISQLTLPIPPCALARPQHGVKAEAMAKATGT